MGGTEKIKYLNSKEVSLGISGILRISPFSPLNFPMIKVALITVFVIFLTIYFIVLVDSDYIAKLSPSQL